jgi:RNA polymerase sigma-70 factor (ECF subfamily)
LRNLEDADEIAQEVFAKVYVAIQTFGGRGSLYAWIYRIAVNECYGLLRKKRFKMVYSSDPTDDTLALRMEAIADGRPTPDRTAMQRDFINKHWHGSRSTTVGCLSRKELRVSPG